MQSCWAAGACAQALEVLHNFSHAFESAVRTDHLELSRRAQPSLLPLNHMPTKKVQQSKKTSTSSRITPATLSLIHDLAQDKDGTILASAKHLQATHSDLGIGTVYLRNPSNPRSMDRRIPAPIGEDNSGDSGPCRFSPFFTIIALMYSSSQQTNDSNNTETQFGTTFEGISFIYITFHRIMIVAVANQVRAIGCNRY